MARAETKNRKASASPKTKPIVEDIPKAPIEETDKKEEIVEVKAKIANCKNLRLRTSPEVKDDNITTLLKADTVVKVNTNYKNDEWSSVEAKNADGEFTGYVMSKYLEVI